MKTMTDTYEAAQKAHAYIATKTDIQPRVALILGSSQGAFAQQVQDAVTIPYTDIPGFPRSTVAGHAGELKVGHVSGVPVAVFCGRVHYYEGYTMQQVVLSVRMLHFWNVPRLIITNAAGGINSAFSVGDFMLLTDHINMMGINPLLGPNDDRFGPRFPDMSFAYTPALQKLAFAAARKLHIKLQKGVYTALTGPTYETPAEVRMVRTIGSDAVGMSTVPETIAAAHQGMEVLGLSMITNLAAGISPGPLDHEEVKEAGERGKGDLFRLLEEIIRRM